jgi:hypothetical protein
MVHGGEFPEDFHEILSFYGPVHGFFPDHLKRSSLSQDAEKAASIVTPVKAGV